MATAGDDPKAIAALAREALSKACDRIREVLERLRESLGLSSPQRSVPKIGAIQRSLSRVRETDQP